MKTHLFVTLLLLTSTAWAEFRAGAAKVDITPKLWPVQMVGSFHERLADKAHDPLYARAIVCDDGETRLAIVIVDNCLIGRNYLDRAKALAAKRTKVRADRILVAATHTHTAPPAVECVCRIPSRVGQHLETPLRALRGRRNAPRCNVRCTPCYTAGPRSDVAPLTAQAARARA